MSKVISSFCSADKPQCVEVEAASDGNVHVTDSKQGRVDRPVLCFTPAEWDAFVEGVKAGEFDLMRLLEASGAPLIGTFAADLA
jgi:hypothetical protein